MHTETIGPLFFGWYGIVFDATLQKPRFERERFSGGVNKSAVERNDKKRVFYVINESRTVVVPNYMRAEFERAVEEYRKKHERAI